MKELGACRGIGGRGYLVKDSVVCVAVVARLVRIEGVCVIKRILGLFDRQLLTGEVKGKRSKNGIGVGGEGDEVYRDDIIFACRQSLVEDIVADIGRDLTVVGIVVYYRGDSLDAHVEPESCPCITYRVRYCAMNSVFIADCDREGVVGRLDARR